MRGTGDKKKMHLRKRNEAVNLKDARGLGLGNLCLENLALSISKVVAKIW